MYKDGVYQNHRSQGTIFHPLTYLTYWGHSAQKHLGLIAPPVHQHSHFDWTWAAVQSAPISPSLSVRGRLCREDKRGASSYKAQLGSEPAVDGGRKREGGYWSIFLFHRKRHSSIICGAQGERPLSVL